MIARRMLIVFASFLLISAIINAFGTSQRAEKAEKPPAQRVVAPAATADGELPADKVVRATLGDVVKVTVTSEVSETAEIVDLGIAEPVDADVPAELTFVADRAGRFPVTLRNSGRPVGSVLVRAR